MPNKTFESVWDAISDSPAEAENLKQRSAIMEALRSHISRLKLKQAEAAKLLGISQPRVSNLMTDKVSDFTLDALINMAAKAGLKFKFKVQRVA